MKKRILIPGTIAQDKDWARDSREKAILPILNANGELCLDFGSVEVATQSFIHALVSEATRILGEAGLARIEFRSCNEQVRESIKTVVQYSLRAREIGKRLKKSKKNIRSRQVPQADSLSTICAVVSALSEGPRPLEVIAEALGYSIRHTQYRARAAETLGFLDIVDGIAFITDDGFELSTTMSGSNEQRSCFIRAIHDNQLLRKVAPNLLTTGLVIRSELIERIARVTGLSDATAARRAQCLLSWRRQLVPGPQLTLALELEPFRIIGQRRSTSSNTKKHR